MLIGMGLAMYLMAEGFYVRAVAANSPHGDADATVVHAEGKVLDASDDARLRGVAPGMPLAQARALLERVRFVPYEPLFYEAARRRWLDALVPFTDRVETHSPHEAVLDLSAHPRPLEIARLAARAASAFEPRLAWAVAPAGWIARLAVEEGVEDVREADNVADLLDPLPLGRLPVPTRVAARLDELGYPTARAARRLSRETLRRQFGEEGERIHAVVRGLWREPAPSSYPEDSEGGSIRLEGGCGSREELGTAAADLARRIGARLLAAEREGREVALHLISEERVETRMRVFARPVRDATSLGAAFCALLGDGASEPVWELRAVVPRLTRAAAVSRGLFDPIGPAPAEADRLADGLREAYGPAAIRPARAIEIPRRRRLLSVYARAIGWR